VESENMIGIYVEYLVFILRETKKTSVRIAGQGMHHVWGISGMHIRYWWKARMKDTARKTQT
jgi:hypothetical protein